MTIWCDAGCERSARRRTLLRQTLHLIHGAFESEQQPVVVEAWVIQSLGIANLLHTIIAEDLHDKEFIASRIEGFEPLEEKVRAYSPEKVAPICGVSADEALDPYGKIPEFKYCAGSGKRKLAEIPSVDASRNDSHCALPGC